ncbi:MAG: GNAT family N-acetyltransferase [Clostridia bacterium]|nr:GNAT family N-acetyltransferase [Clostridia bacterium]
MTQSNGKLYLHVPSFGELDYRAKIMSDPETMAYNRGYDLDFEGYHKDTGCIDFPESERREWYEYYIGREPERFYAYIVRREDGAFIGEVNLHKSCDEYYDMGIVIEAKYRGRGYAKEALRLLLRHAFETMGVKAVHNDFEDERDPALKVHLDCGFREVRREGGLIHLIITSEEFFGK